MRNKNLLSVIVPAYKQEKTIIEDLKNIQTVLTRSKISFEIICVVDGFADKTFELARRLESKKIRILGYETNQGKGYAVRYGMARARGDLVAFIDAGMDINARGLPILLEHMKWYDSDIIVGSIRHSASKVTNYPFKRRVYSVGYHLITRLLFGLKITDSQRGIKIFRREVLEQVLPRMAVKKFAFDIEMLAVAHRLGFRKIHDGPIEMNTERFKYSNIRFSSVFQMLLDTLAIFYRLNLLRYYDQRQILPTDAYFVSESGDLLTKKHFLVSVIIPVRTITDYVKETVDYLKKQSYRHFELIIVTDKKEKLRGAKILASGNPTPAYKRNLGAGIARGSVLAFLDDDSFPETDWLENALQVFSRNEKINKEKPIVGVCGPALTPPSDSLYQKASGWVWSSFFGSGAAGVYRNRIMPEREVDDFPSVNLLVRKEDFWAVGGFDVNHWPGEDTKLCLDLIQRGRIIYSPKVVVYHHRRPVFLPHLQQIARYAKRRGFFARNFPQTSFKINYFLPSLFSYGLIIGCLVAIVFPSFSIILASLVSLYSLILLFAALEVFVNGGGFFLSFLVAVSIYLTHFVYGFLFPFGYFQKRLPAVPREIDDRKMAYVGG